MDGAQRGGGGVRGAVARGAVEGAASRLLMRQHGRLRLCTRGAIAAVVSRAKGTPGLLPTAAALKRASCSARIAQRRAARARRGALVVRGAGWRQLVKCQADEPGTPRLT